MRELETRLAAAQDTIAALSREVQDLRRRDGDGRFAGALRESLVSVAAAGTLAAPAAPVGLLDEIVRTAAGVMQAAAASLLLVDEARGDLVFQVALGDKADAVRQFRVPMGRGIAGYVAVTGQPLAIANAADDPRFAREIGQAIDYIPRTMLCTPLYAGGRVIGVLQLLDKAGGGTFTAEDMDLLGAFARLAALGVEQSRLVHDLRHLFRTLLSEALGADGPATLSTEAAGDFVDRAASTAEQSATMALAALVRDVARHGEAGYQLAVDVLTSLARFLRLQEPAAADVDPERPL